MTYNHQHDIYDIMDYGFDDFYFTILRCLRRYSLSYLPSILFGCRLSNTSNIEIDDIEPDDNND